MRKNLYVSGLFLCILALCICGCGSGGGSTADPMGSATVRFIADDGSIITTTTVGVNGTITLRAWVTNTRTDGTVLPVNNEKVSFVVVNPEGGGTLTASSDRTGSDGTATALFKSSSSTYSDVVRVTTSTGATASIYINKTGGAVEPGIKEMKATVAEVVAGQNSVITVEVVDGAGNHVMNVPVRFSFAINASGAVFSYGGATGMTFTTYTDSSGFASVVYRGGIGDPYNDAYDSVMAEIIGPTYYSSKAVTIKRTKGTPPTPVTELSVTLASSPAADTEVSGGQTRIITATVAGDDKAGAQVTFSIPVNNSGAVFVNSGGFAVSTITVTAGGTGVATVIYRAGSSSTTLAVQDTVQALLQNGANAAIILKRSATAPTLPTTYTVTITPSLTTVIEGQVSIITANVKKTDATGTLAAAPGETVTFSMPVNSSNGTLSALTATTDSSGNAVVIYRPGNTQVSVQDTVQAAVGTAVSAIAISVTGSSVAAYRITLEAKPAILLTGLSNSVITANVKNNAGVAISGVTVTFNATTGSLSPATATTDGSGNAVVTYTGDGLLVKHTAVVTARITIGGLGYTDAVVIDYPATATGYGISLTATPGTLNSSAGGTSVLTATVSSADPSTQPVSGRTVTFTILSVIPSTAGTVSISGTSTAVAVTDGVGKASVVLSRGAAPVPTTAGSVLVRASSGGADAFATITLTFP